MIPKNKIIIQVVIAFSIFFIFAAPVPDAIIISIKTGNSKELSKHFNDNIELVILDDENVYSRYQAEQIMKNFFSRNVPKTFSILHEGGKEGSNYAIGNLVTTNGEYRVYFLIKNKGEQALIHQLRIEEKDDN